MLTLFVVFRFAIPSRYVVGPLGGAGAPAQLVGMGVGLWWLADRLVQPWSRSRLVQPIRRCALAFLLVVLVAYLVAAVRPISADEQLAADRALLNVLAWTGVMFAAMDGVTSRSRLDTLVRRLVLLGGLEACVGILQLLTGRTLIEYLHLPGLSDTGVDEGLLSRGSFLRPAGTAVHPIEFGVTLAMLLPLALHLAVADGGRRSAAARWWPVGAITFALALSVSRSALICAAVGLPLLLTAWPTRLRRRVYLAVPVLAAGLALALPGFLRTVLNLFTGLGTDSSASSRTDSYALAWSFITRAPVIGRGMGTFLPRYRILDNQYLGSLIEIGAVGVACMLCLFVAPAVTGWRLRMAAVTSPAASLPVRGAVIRGAGHARAGEGAPRSQLGPALAAGIAGGTVSFAFFDAWNFPMIPSVMFVLFGCVGALRRLQREGDRAEDGAGPAAMPDADRPGPRGDEGQEFGGPGNSGREIRGLEPRGWESGERENGQGEFGGAEHRGPVEGGAWPVLAVLGRRVTVVLVGILLTLGGAAAAAGARGVWFEQGVVVFIAPPGAVERNAFERGSSSLVSTAGLVGREVEEPMGGPLALSPQATLVDLGIRDGVWVRLPNDGGQWRTSFDRAELDLQVTGSDVARVRERFAIAVEQIRDTLRGGQVTLGVPRSAFVDAELSPPAPPVMLRTGSRSRAVLAALVLGVVATLVLTVRLDRLLGPARRDPLIMVLRWWIRCGRGEARGARGLGQGTGAAQSTARRTGMGVAVRGAGGLMRGVRGLTRGGRR